MSDSTPQGCYRHPDVLARVRCQRCERRICPNCQNQAAVGVQCPTCTKAGRPRKIKNLSSPVVTTSIVVICVALQLVSAVTNVVTQYLGYAPVLGVYEPYRMITTAFLHGGFAHLIMNMMALWVVGSELERILGKARFLALYLLSALGGSVAWLAWTLVSLDTFVTVTVGASGAVFGLFGALFVIQKRVGADLRAITVLIALNVFLGFILPNIAWQAHLGGMLVGAGVMATMFKTVTSGQSRTSLVLTVLGWTGLLSCITVAIYAFLLS